MSGVLDLLGAGTGTFVYHLMILLALLAAAGISYIEYRRTSNPDQYRILCAFSALFVLRIPLLFGDSTPVDPTADVSLFLKALVPILVYALEVSSLTLLWWAFISPLIDRRANRVFLFGSLGLALVLAVAFFPSWYQTVQSFAFFDYAAFWQQKVWDLWAVALSLSGAVLLFTFRHRLGYILPAVSFILLTLGNTLILLDGVLIEGIIGLGRLINLIGYPLIVVAVYRSALQDLYVYRQELETLSEGSLRQTRELLFLVEVSRAMGKSLNLETVLKEMTESVGHALDADRVAILLTDESLETVELAAQYVPLQRSWGPTPTVSCALSEQPVLDHVVRRRKQVALDPRGQSRLQPLFALLGSQEQGPVILQPLLRQQRVLGVLAVGRDRSKRPFTTSEERLCGSVASQIAASIENARLYHNLAVALEQQREEAGQREAILQSINEGIIVNNAEGRAVMLNASAEKILGLTREQVINRPIQHLLEAAAADRQMDLTSIQDISAPLQTLFELRNQQIQVSAAPVVTADGESLGVVAVLRDITKEVQAEEAKREFITVISHELRTPLTAILGYTEALYSGMVGEVSETQAGFIRTIHDNARKMVAMADNMIALSEAERGHLELEYGETDLEMIIGEVIQAFSTQMQNKQLDWTIDVEETLPIIEADPSRIRQVLANLVSNAVKFTLPGGHVTVGGANVDATPDAPGFCRLWVTDTGIGIPPEKQAVIWERFTQSEGRIQEDVDGLGLGLSIVRSLVEAHGGRVWVDSVPGRGSTFTLLIPTQRPENSPLDARGTYPDMDQAAPPSR
ncbi:MAG: PAS domain S-box protein [Anaerolineae bacterium]|nr:PAS domain S-box protein [Anaerolineae bacterium]